MLAETYVKENGSTTSDMELERLLTKTKELIVVSSLRIHNIGAHRCENKYLILTNEN